MKERSEKTGSERDGRGMGRGPTFLFYGRKVWAPSMARSPTYILPSSQPHGEGHRRRKEVTGVCAHRVTERMGTRLIRLDALARIVRDLNPRQSGSKVPRLPTDLERNHEDNEP